MVHRSLSGEGQATLRELTVAPGRKGSIAPGRRWFSDIGRHPAMTRHRRFRMDGCSAVIGAFAVKPILVPIIRGNACTLDEEAQVLLARWITVKAIVTEYSQDDQRLTPSADRVALTNEYTIPPYFCIRVGRNASSWPTLFYRHSTTISLDRLATAPQMDGMERNIQQITMLFDALIIQVLAVRVAGHRIESRIAPQIGAQLWPIQTPTLDFGQFTGTGDIDAYIPHF
jgi:hypothetical protein